MPDWTDNRTLLWIAAAIYAVAFAVGVTLLARGRKQHAGVMLAALAIGLVVQTAGLYLRGLIAKGCPLGNPFEILQFIAWSATVLYLFVGSVFRTSLLGFFTAGLVAVLSILSLCVPAWDTPYESGYFGGNPWIETHAAVGAFSYGVFAVLALTSLMFLLQHYGLKHKLAQGLFRFLPSLFELDHMSRRLLGLGLAVLTFSLVIGFIYWLGYGSWLGTGKLVATGLLWIAYAVVLTLRFTNRLAAQPFAGLCCALFVIAMTTVGPVDASRQPPTAAALPAP